MKSKKLIRQKGKREKRGKRKYNKKPVFNSKDWKEIRRTLSKKKQNMLSMHDSLEAKSDILEMGVAKFLRHGGATPEQIQIVIHYLVKAQSNMEQANELYYKVYGRRR